jgi:hypothetical protein
MRVFLTGALALALLQAPAFAQEAGGDTRCFLGSKTFSAGAAMSAGSGTMVCEAGSWVAAEGDAAGCLLEGELSSVGAVVGINNNDTMSLQCAAGGRWETIPIASAAAE